MRRILTLLACLAVTTVASAQEKTATLNFKFEGIRDGEAEPFRVITSAIYAERNITEIDPNLGDASIVVPTDGITAVDFYFDPREIVFYVEPSKTYNITIADTPSGTEVFIDDKALQRYLDISKDWDIYKYDSGSDFTETPLDTSGIKMMENFERMIAEDMAQLKGVKMSREMKKVLTKDIELYHITSLSMAIHQDWWRWAYRADKMFPDYVEAWDRLFEKYPVSPDYKHSVYLSYYARQYVINYLMLKNGMDRYNLSNEDRIDLFYDAIKDDGLREKILTEAISAEALGNRDRDEYIIPLINKFLEHYPENEYRPDLEWHLATIREWKNDPASSFSPDMKLVEGYENIKSIKEAVAKFKGKPLFIDFWFITCPHCIVEFRKSAQLKEFLKANSIEMLYMAREDESKDTQWRNAILHYGLTGNHIRMSPELTKDFNDNYNVRGYPQYMIVDAEGNIVVVDALRPSSGKELESQIKKALGMSLY